MWVLVVCLGVWVGGGRGEPFREAQERLIDGLATAATERIKEAHRSENWQCDCSYHECGWSFEDNMTCIDSRAPNDERKCAPQGGCTPIGLFPDRAFATTPPGVNPDTLGDATSGRFAVNAAEDVCMLQGLEREGAYQAATQWKKKEFSGWAILGTRSGVSFSWPGRASDRLAGSIQGSSCPQYDPRLRPWYAPAVSPNRAAIFLIDTSVVSIAKQTTEAILSTLSISDQIAMIPYLIGYESSEKENKKGSPRKYRFSQATIEGKQTVKMGFEKEKAKGLRSAMEQAFEMLEEVPSDFGDKIIFYISGSEVVGKTSRDVLNYIESQQDDESPVHFLTFTFGSREESAGFARKLACKHKGLWTGIVDSGLPKMDNYFSFIALAAEHAADEPQGAHFSEIYPDAGFLGNVMTTSKAFFEKSNCKAGPKRILRGVVGIDTQVGKGRTGDLQVNNEKALMGRKPKLSTKDVENLECQLQIIRGWTETHCPGRLEVHDVEVHYDVVRTNEEYYVFHKHAQKKCGEAVKKCEDGGGRLAVVDSGNKQNLLSSLAPDDGSWILLESLSSNPDECSQVKIAGSNYECAIIDNRGALHNVASAPCEEKRFFFCEFSRHPGDTQGSHIPLLKNRPEACMAQNQCSSENTADIMPSKAIFCNLGENGGDISPEDAMCCSDEEQISICPFEEPTVSKAKANSEVVIASVVPSVVLLIIIVLVYLLRRRRQPPPPYNFSKDILDGSTIIDHGASGTVKSGRFNDQDVAIKVFKRERRQDFEAELQIYQRLPRNQNIIKLLGIQDENSPDNTNGEVCLVLELMDMNLKEYLKARSNQTGFTYRALLKIFLDIASGLEHLHKNKIIHRDIKPHNVLIKEQGDGCIAKLCDFGHSKSRIQESVTLTGIRGTTGYMSPELLQMFYNVDGEKVKVSSATDIYSLGVVMCECIVGSEAFLSEPSFPEMPENMRELIKKCRHDIDTERPKASEVCAQLRSFLQSRWASHQISRESSV